MRRIIRKIDTMTSLGLVAAMLAILAGPFAQIAYAAALANNSDTMSSLKVSTLSNHFILFRTPSGAQGGATPDTITVTFPAGFTMGTFALLNFDLGATAGGQTTCTAGLTFTERTLAAVNGVDIWGTAQAGQVVTFTSPTNAAGTGDLATNACVRVRIGNNAVTGGAGANQITNPAAAGSNLISISGNAGFGDSGDIMVQILTDDQVATTATVGQTLTFSISDNAIGFGALSATVATFANGAATGSATEVEAHNLIVGTNAASGYATTVTGTTLTVGAFTVTAIGAANTASAAGTEQYGIRMTATGGIGTVSAPYAAAGFALDTAAFPDEVAVATGASANTTFSARYLANITSVTEAGAYTSTLTYTATATF